MRNRKNRSLRWRVPFKTIKERDAMICIYDENYHGDVIDLEAALNPIETEDNNTEELLSPIRSQTGYLRIIDNGDIAGLMPSDNMNHYVELYVGDVLEWCGYMQADSFSEDWDATPIEVEFPLISGIGVLEGLYLDEDRSFGDFSLAYMMKECFDMACIDYDYIYIPAEAFPQGENYHALMRLKISRFNFFYDNDADLEDVDYKKYDAWSAMDVIKEILTFFGWSLYERGTSLFIVSHGGNGLYKRMAYSDFGGYAYTVGSSSDRKAVQLSNLEFDGDTHTKDILQGYNLFKISADINAVGDVVPIINEDALGYKGLLSVEYKTPTGYVVRHEKLKMYGGGGYTQDTEMFQYEAVVTQVIPGKPANPDNPDDHGTPDKEVVEIRSVTFNERLFYNRIGACYAEYDLYETADIPNKKNYDYKKAIIFTLRDKKKHGISVGHETDYPLLKMRNSRSARYNYGAFVFRISGSTAVHKLWEQDINENFHQFDFILRMRCGDMYWNGSQWTYSYSTFTVHVNSQGKIDSNKTLDMPYNGADGYVMPINTSLSGDVELTIYALGNYGVEDEIDRIYVEGLKVEYFGDDNKMDEKKSQANKYQSMIDDAFTNDMSVDLKIATYNENMTGYALLTLDGSYVQYLYYSNVGSSMRPEKYLLSKLKRIYGRKIERLNVEVERTNLLPYDIVQYNNKNYAMSSSKTNWSEEHQTLTITDVK